MIEKKWWKECVVYQIYPRSFKDSNNDGIGDLRGIIQKLDYLQWLGVGAIWLNPIYDSPNDDMGYDIRDYEKIMCEFGSMADFDELLAEMHKRGIRLIMDLVVNHSSDEHAWFVESRKSKDNPYRDFYIWRPGHEGKEPNNWTSLFTPSAWKYDAQTDEWYLHLFSEKQPDLNWENPDLRENVYAMINRWLDKGVDGFRMDVINLIAKKPGLPDGNGKANSSGYVMSDEHFANQPKLHDYLREMRKKCFDGRNCMCVGETPFTGSVDCRKIVDPANHELDMIFRFELMDIDSGPGGKFEIIDWDLPRFKAIMSDLLIDKGWASLFWSNHDQPRPVGRFGSVASEELRVRSAKMLAVLMYLRKGTPYIYQGEEIGMTNVPFKCIAEMRDIESLNYYALAQKNGCEESAWRSLEQKGRDNARTPMQWDDSAYAGFSQVKPWIKVNPNYTEINVAAAKNEPNSILHFYRELLALRNGNDTLLYGDYRDILMDNVQIFAYVRSDSDREYRVLCNMSSKTAVIPQPAENCHGEVALSNLSQYAEGELQPYEVRVYSITKL